MSHKFVLTIAASLWTAQMLAGSAVRGSVVDPQGAMVDGASLVLYAQGEAVALARGRTVNGAFSFAAVPAGEYLLEAAADGFRRVSVAVRADQEVTVRLTVAGVDQRVVVTAEGAAQTIDQVSKAATVIGMAEIAERNEYSLMETLRDTPGLLVRNLGGPGQATSVRIRGLRADATAVLIDGLRFRDVATIQGDASSFLSNLNVINFDRVEVLRGSGSSLYGTNAVGGTVNVVSDTGGGAVHGGLQVEGGSLGLIRARGTVSGGVRDNRLTYSAGLLHLNVMSGIDGNDRARSSGLQTFTRYVFGPNTSLAGRVFFSDDFVQPNTGPSTDGVPDANLPSSTIVPAVPFVGGVGTYVPGRDDPDSRRASRLWSGALIFRQRLGAPAEWVTSYQRVHTNRQYNDGPLGFGFQPFALNASRFRGTIDTVDSKVLWRPKRWYSLAAGYEFEREGYLNSDTDGVAGPEGVATRTEAAQRSNAFYFANQITMAQDRLQISLSGRAQRFALDRPRFVYSGTANNYDSAGVNTPPRALTGDVAVSYFLPSSGTKLRVHGGNSYRAPGLYERYGSGFYYSSFSNGVVFSPYGDPRLAPDRYNSVDGGVDQYLFGEKVRLSGTWFYTRTVQITQFDSSANIVVPGADPFGRDFGYYNGAGGISRGVELTAEMRPVRGTLFRTSYSYVNADTDQDNAVRGLYVSLGTPAHSVQAMVNQQLGRRTEVTGDFYHSSSYLDPLYAGFRTRAYQYPGFTKLDLVLSHRISEGERHTLRGYVKVENALDRLYYESGYRAAGATLLTGLQILFR